MRLINIKNISIISFIVAVMICFCNVAFAEEAVSTYEISDLSITVDIPESITVLTPKVKENEEFFKKDFCAAPCDCYPGRMREQPPFRRGNGQYRRECKSR